MPLGYVLFNVEGIAPGNNVRFGSKADICGAQTHVCFTPKSGHVQRTRPSLLWANSGHETNLVCHNYSMTTSARASTAGGIVRPSSLAVLIFSTRCSRGVPTAAINKFLARYRKKLMGGCLIFADPISGSNYSAGATAWILPIPITNVVRVVTAKWNLRTRWKVRQPGPPCIFFSAMTAATFIQLKALRYRNS
jgi:hypothetical protein